MNEPKRPVPPNTGSPYQSPEIASPPRPQIGAPPKDKGHGAVEVKGVEFQLGHVSSVQGTPSAQLDGALGAGVSHSADVVRESIRKEYRYGALGLVLGLVTIIGGVILGLNGIAGSSSWTAKLFGFESQLNDAAPGVILFVVGVFLVWATRPKITASDLKG